MIGNDSSNSDDTFIYANRTANITTTQISMTDGSSHLVTFTTDFVAFQAFATYQLDPSPLTNPLRLVTTRDLSSSTRPMLVHPDWILAAWTVDQDGELPSMTVATLEVVDFVLSIYDLNNTEQLTPGLLTSAVLVSIIPIAQALSLIDFTTNPIPPGTNPAQLADPEHPLLYRNACIYVWAYGLSSRTSKMGATVAYPWHDRRPRAVHPRLHRQAAVQIPSPAADSCAGTCAYKQVQWAEGR